jgi:hypothetical protein
MRKELTADAAADLQFIIAVAKDANVEDNKAYSDAFSALSKNGPIQETKYAFGQDLTAMLLIFWIALMKVQGDEDDELIPFTNAMVKHEEMEDAVHLVAMHLFGMSQSVSVEVSNL